MLVEVVAIVSGSLVAITGLTLRFCSVIDKRERAEQVEDDEMRLDRAEPFPHVRINIDTRCPFCSDGGEQKRGPKLPKRCPQPEMCSIKEPHSHLKCQTCGSRYAMKAAA
jgi:ABC-type nickel/cobalt efflux system permease component RcnA